MWQADDIPESLRAFVSRCGQQLEQHPIYSEAKLSSLLSDEAFAAQLRTVWAASEFMAGAILTQPHLLQELYSLRHQSERDYPALLRAELAPFAASDHASGSQPLKQALRRFHRREFVAILWRDLCGLADMHAVCRRMSDLADAEVDAALGIVQQWSAREWGQPLIQGEPQSLVVIGMGKLGARELNVSSDIDLIFTYPAAGEISPPVVGTESLTHQQFFTRVGQRLIDVLDHTTADGFLFRVDMRLRPYGSEGALAISFDAMEEYYQSQGRDWERYAMIKARVIAGDLTRGQELMKRLRPFVYRRYLDFAMFESLRDMKTQINKQARGGRLADDIKLGVGGIREVEFIVQALQLVHGGRDRLLQEASIVRALNRLAAAGYLPESVTGTLLRCYEYLRRLEHRLQAVANQQTQRLPRDLQGQSRVAFAMGDDAWTTTLNTLTEVRRQVAEHFRDVLHVDQERNTVGGESRDWLPLWRQEWASATAIAALAEAGYESPEDTLSVLAAMRRERRVLTLPAESRQRLDAFMPLLLNAAMQTPHPSQCISRVMPLVEAVTRRTAYLVLLMENPGALRQLVTFCAASPIIAEHLARFPVLLDELLDVLDAPPERSRLRDELQSQLLRIDPESFEEQLECLRYFKQSHELRVAAAEVTGHLHLMKVSDYLTFTAEVILEGVLALCWQHLVRRHGYPVHFDGSHGEPEFALIGYGKLGGIELGYNSDLDLVFLHRAALDQDTVTVGDQQAINSRAFYIKLAQRIIMMLGTYTLTGTLYEVDTRLRPSGESGLLVSSLDAFTTYQQTSAWTWEHQALVRARGVGGSERLLQAFTAVRRDILGQQRDPAALGQAVTEMRERMRRELSSGASSEAERAAFQLKQGPGGIVDIEFLVQYLVLAHAHRHPALLDWTDNYRILEAARDASLLAPEDMQALIDAYLTLRAVSHRLALRQSPADAGMGDLALHQTAVQRIWRQVFPQP